MRVSTLLIALLSVAAAFVPQATPRFARSHTVREFGFLKELGLEKPSWLPDFGGKKEEEPAPAPEPVAEEEPAPEPEDATEDAAEE